MLIPHRRSLDSVSATLPDPERAQTSALDIKHNNSPPQHLYSSQQQPKSAKAHSTALTLEKPVQFSSTYLPDPERAQASALDLKHNNSPPQHLYSSQ